MSVIGGLNYIGEQYASIYYSEDGNNWVLAIDETPLRNRHFYTAVVANEKIYVTGGYSFDNVALDV